MQQPPETSMQSPSFWEGSKLIMTSLLISGFGGVVHFFRNGGHEKENVWQNFFIKLIESCFVGVIAGWVCKAQELQDNYTFSIIGMSGYIGVELLDFGKRILIKKIKEKYEVEKTIKAKKRNKRRKVK